jgi:hypothetical protein
VRSDRERLLNDLGQAEDSDAAADVKKDQPLSWLMAEHDLRKLHTREVTRWGNATNSAVTRLSCFPGATRTYCSLQGVLYTCEKTPRGKLYELGDIENDVDADRAYDLVEKVRLLCDCGNCVANRFCTLCSAQMIETQPGVADAVAFQKDCQATQANLPGQLKDYTELMESNPDIVDDLVSAEQMDDDWLNSVRIFPHIDPPVELTVEELEAFA